MWPKTPQETMNEWVKNYINEQPTVCTDEEWEQFCKEMNLQTDGPSDEAVDSDAFLKELKESDRF